MNKTATIGLTAAAFIACASAASAAVVTVTQIQTTGPLVLPISTTQSFAQHNGTLASLSDTITESLTETLVFTNTGAGSGSFSGHLTNIATKTFPAGFTVSVTDVGEALSSGIVPAGGTVTMTGTGTATATVTGTPAMFAAFEGLGSVSATLKDHGDLSCTANIGNGVCGFTDTGTITDVLSYDFSTTPPPVPEPATLALLGTGLAWFGMARRRRRRQR